MQHVYHSHSDFNFQFQEAKQKYKDIENTKVIVLGDANANAHFQTGSGAYYGMLSAKNVITFLGETNEEESITAHLVENARDLREKASTFQDIHYDASGENLVDENGTSEVPNNVQETKKEGRIEETVLKLDLSGDEEQKEGRNLVAENGIPKEQKTNRISKKLLIITLVASILLFLPAISPVIDIKQMESLNELFENFQLEFSLCSGALFVGFLFFLCIDYRAKKPYQHRSQYREDRPSNSQISQDTHMSYRTGIVKKN